MVMLTTAVSIQTQKPVKIAWKYVIHVQNVSNCNILTALKLA